MVVTRDHDIARKIGQRGTAHQGCLVAPHTPGYIIKQYIVSDCAAGILVQDAVNRAAYNRVAVGGYRPRVVIDVQAEGEQRAKIGVCAVSIADCVPDNIVGNGDIVHRAGRQAASPKGVDRSAVPFCITIFRKDVVLHRITIAKHHHPV